MKQKTRKLTESYKTFRSQKQTGESRDHLTDEGILIETEKPSSIGESAGKEERV